MRELLSEDEEEEEEAALSRESSLECLLRPTPRPTPRARPRTSATARTPAVMTRMWRRFWIRRRVDLVLWALVELVALRWAVIAALMRSTVFRMRDGAGSSKEARLLRDMEAEWFEMEKVVLDGWLSDCLRTWSATVQWPTGSAALRR